VFGKLPSYYVFQWMTSYDVYKDVHTSASTSTTSRQEIRGFERPGRARAEGYLTDLLLVDGDLLDDIRLLQDKNRLIAIMKDGAFHKRPVAHLLSHRIAAE
jgi:hypothetical protein